MKVFKVFGLIVVLLAVTSLSLAACGDTPPATPVPSNKATVTPSLVSGGFPVYQAATALTMNDDLQKHLYLLLNSGLPKANIKGYVTHDSAEQVKDFYEKSLTSNGYRLLVTNSTFGDLGGFLKVLDEVYNNTSGTVVVNYSGPYNQKALQNIFGNYPETLNQVKEGDSVVFIARVNA